MNDTVLNNFPGGLYRIETDDKIPDNFKYPLATIQAAKNQKQTKTGGLIKFLKLKISAKVMLTINLEIQDCPYWICMGSVRKAYVKFPDKQAGLKAMRSSYLVIKNSWVPIENVKSRSQ